MIVVKLEMWPGGDEARSYDIGRTYINNVSPDFDNKSDTRGDYDVRVMRKGSHNVSQRDLFAKGLGVLRKGHVANYPRSSYNVWRLVMRALKSTFPEEKAK